MSAATSARHSSATNEHYTPARIVEAARALLDGIDLDPASSQVAQQTVRAEEWYGFDHPDPSRRDGFGATWHGRVFLNPPGGICDDQGRLVIKASKAKGTPACTVSGACGLPPGHKHEGVQSSQKAWWREMAHAYAAGAMRSVVFVAFSVELLQTSQVFARDEPNCTIPLDYPICYPKDRVPYLRPDGTVGKSPPHSSCIVYLPPIGHLAGSGALYDLERHFDWLGACR